MMTNFRIDTWFKIEVGRWLNFLKQLENKNRTKNKNGKLHVSFAAFSHLTTCKLTVGNEIHVENRGLKPYSETFYIKRMVCIQLHVNDHVCIFQPPFLHFFKLLFSRALHVTIPKNGSMFPSDSIRFVLCVYGICTVRVRQADVFGTCALWHAV